MAVGQYCTSNSPPTRFSHRSPPLVHPWLLMTATTKRVSQTIIEVEAKSRHDNTGGDEKQASLPNEKGQHLHLVTGPKDVCPQIP